MIGIGIGIGFKKRSGSGSGWTPQIPTGLTLTVISDTEIQADWTNVDVTGDGAKVYISTDNVTFTLIDTVALGVTTSNLTGLTSDTLYYAYVVSYKAAVESDPSNTDSDTTFSAEAIALIARMTALSEEPTAAQKTNIKLTIHDLLADCLFARRFNALWFGRGYGVQSTKLNWIKDDFNLVEAGANALNFTEAVGYSSNADSCLDTTFIPNADTVNMTYWDQCVFMKIGGAVSPSGAWRLFMGCEGSNGNNIGFGYRYDGQVTWRLGGGYQDEMTVIDPIVGYNFMTKLSDTTAVKIIRDSAVDIAANNGNNLPDVISVSLLSTHNGAGFSAFALDESIFEVAGIGGYLSEAEIVIMQNIINGYISRL